MLKKRRLGNTKLLVSEIGLGCLQLGGLNTINSSPTTFGNVPKEIAFELIQTALNLGINTFDTADIYSLGNSENRLGQALSEVRSSVYILTKGGGVASYEKPFEIDLSYHNLCASIDRSLKRLKTDYVDLFQTHKAPQSETEFKNVEKAFDEIKSSGKAKYCGISIGLDYKKGIELIERDIVDTIQLYFSLINYEPIKELLPLAKKKGVGIIAAEPLAQGFLTDKYSGNTVFPSTDIRHTLDSNYIQTRIERSKQFNFLLNSSRKLNQIAISYILGRDEVSTCIPSAKSVEQLKSNVKSVEVSLTKDELEKIEEIHKTWNMRSN